MFALFRLGDYWALESPLNAEQAIARLREGLNQKRSPRWLQWMPWSSLRQLLRRDQPTQVYGDIDHLGRFRVSHRGRWGSSPLALRFEGRVGQSPYGAVISGYFRFAAVSRVLFIAFYVVAAAFLVWVTLVVIADLLRHLASLSDAAVVAIALFILGIESLYVWLVLRVTQSDTRAIKRWFLEEVGEPVIRA